MDPSLRHVLLQFDPRLNPNGDGTEERADLSVVVEIGDTLWVASDETVCLTRLSREGAGAYGRHTAFDVADFLDLPGPEDCEADLEGLDHADGYLWMTGSHSLKRGKPDPGDGRRKNLRRLARVTTDSNRFLLARIPVVAGEGGVPTLAKKAGRDGTGGSRARRRTAAVLRCDTKGNDLTDALAGDEHLGWALRVPSKDNGLDIEGLAVSGSRVFLGLRGPVLRGWAVVLEVEVREARRGELRLRKVGPKGRRYRKHFLDLRGLGIREMCLDGGDLLLLAGPTMDLDGPSAVFCWKGGANPPGRGDNVVFQDRLPKVLDVPYGVDEDHAEGMTFRTDGDGTGRRSLLVVYDSPAPARMRADGTFVADAFDLYRES